MTGAMSIEVLDTPDLVAEKAAAIIAEEARSAVAERGRFVLAISGGHTPWLMLRILAIADVPWPAVHIVQVDERVAPAESPDRNFAHLRKDLLQYVPLAAVQIHQMPVEATDLATAAIQYARTLQRIAGSPPVLDLVHLGLGPDGHTASLVPGDPVLDTANADVAVTQAYQGRRRMTLTYPMINRSRRVLWVVTGSEKSPMLTRLVDGDESIPAGRVRRERALLFVDEAAAAKLPAEQKTGKQQCA